MTDLLTGVDPVASWILALALLAVVSVVVWLLLRLVTRTATEIEATVAEVWDARAARRQQHHPHRQGARDRRRRREHPRPCRAHRCERRGDQGACRELPGSPHCLLAQRGASVMETSTLLILVTAIRGPGFFLAVVAFALLRIAPTLESIGGARRLLPREAAARAAGDRARDLAPARRRAADQRRPRRRRGRA